MEYIMIDNFNGNLNIVCKDDNSGEPLIYNNLEKASEELEGICQDGQIIPLGIDLIYLISELYNAVENGGTITHITDLIADVLDIEDENLI